MHEGACKDVAKIYLRRHLKERIDGTIPLGRLPAANSARIFWECRRSARLQLRAGRISFRIWRRRRGGRGPRGRRGGRDGRAGGGGCSDRASLRLVLLKLIADEPRHGYDLIRAIEEMTGGDYAPSPGVVYPTLTLLPGHGADRRDRRRRIAKERSRSQTRAAPTSPRMRTRSKPCSSGSRRPRPIKTARHPPIGRAIGNLMNALRHRIAHDGFDDKLVHEITEILDDAARRIERVA